MILVGMGFLPWWGMRIRDLRKSIHKKAPILVANHVAMIDILVIIAYFDEVPSFIARKGVEGAPMVGKCATAIQCIYIGDGISGTSEEIRKRAEANDPGVPPLLIFPEGTTTNGKYLIPFKFGAFNPGAPVHPIVLRYPFSKFSPAFETMGPIEYLFNMLTAFSHKLEMDILDVYDPTTEEIAEPNVYARHMEKLMAKQLRCKIYPSNRPMKMVYHQFLWKGGMDFDTARKKCIELGERDPVLLEYLGTLTSSLN